MDGLNEEADIVFILTSNRPEALERALASGLDVSIRRSSFRFLTTTAARSWCDSTLGAWPWRTTS